jgi:hypothetical protein
MSHYQIRVQQPVIYIHIWGQVLIIPIKYVAVPRFIKLTLKLEDNSPIFSFDLVSDPYEENNLIASDFEKEEIQQLAAKLNNWKENCIAYHDKNFA